MATPAVYSGSCPSACLGAGGQQGPHQAVSNHHPIHHARLRRTCWSGRWGHGWLAGHAQRVIPRPNALHGQANAWRTAREQQSPTVVRSRHPHTAGCGATPPTGMSGGLRLRSTPSSACTSPSCRSRLLAAATLPPSLLYQLASAGRAWTAAGAGAGAGAAVLASKGPAIMRHSVPLK